jgi:hypothetical protein
MGKTLRTWSYVAPEMHTPPGFAIDCSRAAILTPWPKRSPPSAYHYVTDAEDYAPVRRKRRVGFGQSGLRLYRALHGVHCASELRKNTVASGVRYAAPVFTNEPVEDRAPLGQPLERADLISAHEAAVALDIRCEDCDEASADFRSI